VPLALPSATKAKPITRVPRDQEIATEQQARATAGEYYRQTESNFQGRTGEMALLLCSQSMGQTELNGDCFRGYISNLRATS
jgi:hypothetical protein